MPAAYDDGRKCGEKGKRSVFDFEYYVRGEVGLVGMIVKSWEGHELRSGWILSLSGFHVPAPFR